MAPRQAIAVREIVYQVTFRNAPRQWGYMTRLMFYAIFFAFAAEPLPARRDWPDLQECTQDFPAFP